MIFNRLPDDCLKQIFFYLEHYIHLRMLESSHSFFCNGFSRDFIANYLSKRKQFIRDFFPPLIINMVGGYNQILHYPVIQSPTTRKNTRIYTSNYHIVPSPTFTDMPYSVMIGVVQQQAFISFIVSTTKLFGMGGHIPVDKDLSVLTIYSAAPFCLSEYRYFTRPEWMTHNNLISPTFSNSLAGYVDGYYHIHDLHFYNKIQYILSIQKQKDTDNPLHSFSIGSSHFDPLKIEVPNIPYYKKPLTHYIPL